MFPVRNPLVLYFLIFVLKYAPYKLHLTAKLCLTCYFYSILIFWILLHENNISFFSSRGGGSNEYPQSIFLSRNKKNNVYPCKPQFYYIKVRFKGSKLYRYVFVMLLIRATSEDSDQPVHSHSLIRIFTGRISDSQRCRLN